LRAISERALIDKRSSSHSCIAFARIVLCFADDDLVAAIEQHKRSIAYPVAFVRQLVEHRTRIGRVAERPRSGEHVRERMMRAIDGDALLLPRRH